MNLNAPSTRRRVVPRRLKNQDIPEGGAKAVVLVDATGHGDDAWAGRGRPAFREYLNRKAVAAFADALLDVSLESETLPYLGPDEQVVPQDITRIVENAARRGHPRPEALMSSKPGAGIYLCRNQIVAASRLNHGIHAIDATPARWRARLTG